MLPRFLRRESTLALALAALVFWAPLPAGSVTPAAELFLRLATCSLLVVSLAVAGEGAHGLSRLPVLALAGVAALGVIQSLPWPAALAALVSPEHARLHRQAVELVGGAAQGVWLPLSLDAAVTRSSAVAWFVAAALLATVLVAGGRSRHRRWLLAALLATAGAQIVLGLTRLGRELPGVLGEALLDPSGRLRGTYANPNSLSFLLEMALVAAAAWAWYALARRGVTGRRWGALPPIAVWLTLFAAVVTTGSRAGLLAALGGTLAQLAALAWVEQRRRAAAIVIVAVLAALVALIAAGSQLEIRRYETVTLFEDNLRSRLAIVEPSLELWQRFPVVGTGLGTFEDAFPMTMPAELGGIRWNRAHNDPLELLLTGGVVGLGLAGLAFVTLARPVWRAARGGRRREDRAAGLAGLGALVAAGCHELLDFGLVMPGNVLALLAVAGSAAAVGFSLEGEPVAERGRPGGAAAG